MILAITTFIATLFSCKGAGGDYPGDAYAPDMYYSRAYETYAYNSNDAYAGLKKRGINYTSMPVPGTMARGDGEAYPFPNSDTGYVQAKAYKNPYDTMALSADVMTEAERLYLEARAAEWTEATSRWSQHHPFAGQLRQGAGDRYP